MDKPRGTVENRSNISGENHKRKRKKKKRAGKEISRITVNRNPKMTVVQNPWKTTSLN